MHNVHRVTALCNHLFPPEPNHNNHHNYHNYHDYHDSLPATASSSSSSSSSYQVIIVGAGVAGAALAAGLGKQGKRVLCVERDLSMPDRIVGELLQPGGMKKLEELGIAECTQGIDACDIHGYSVFLHNDRVRVPYSNSTRGRSFHHGRFVDNLRQAAHACPSVDLLQGTVTGLIQTGADHGPQVQGIRFRTGTGERREVYAPLTVVCDGSGSFLRRQVTAHINNSNNLNNSNNPNPNPNTDEMQTRSHFVALLLRNAGEQIPFPNHGHVILADPSPVLVYPISASGDVRVLVDIPGTRLPSIRSGEMARYLREQIEPQIPEEIQPAFREAVEEGQIRSMPNRERPGRAQDVNGVILLGDAFNCRHPLTGGGMTVALSDCVIIRDILCHEVTDISQPHLLSQALSTFYERRKPMAATINILAAALYSVFARGDVQEMRQACFEYFKLGGPAVAGPIGLISGQSQRPYELLAHFFAVAVFGAGRMVLSNPLQIPRAFRLVRSAASIVRPLIYQEKVLCWLPEFGLDELPTGEHNNNS